MFALEYSLSSHGCAVAVAVASISERENGNWNRSIGRLTKGFATTFRTVKSWRGLFNVGPLWFCSQKIGVVLPWVTLQSSSTSSCGGGEEINEKCGPFSTAFHAAMPDSDPTMWELLVSKGADVNAVGACRDTSGVSYGDY